jgi:Activator of Hsp90 ATPase homolog 1-like protein
MSLESLNLRFGHERPIALAPAGSPCPILPKTALRRRADDADAGWTARLHVEALDLVESLVFETDDPAFAGRMTIITTLADVDGGTEVCMSFEGLPPGVRPTDNELGTRMALAKLAALLEAG